MPIISGNIWYSSRAKQSTNDLAINSEGETLLISYRPKTVKSFYDISDVNGKILITGNICMEGNTSIALHFLRKGSYKLTIVDGQDMMQINLNMD